MDSKDARGPTFQVWEAVGSVILDQFVLNEGF